jgi:dTDP-4-dehydrorhamnose reductase
MRVLVLGATGMLGHQVLARLARGKDLGKDLDVHATVRDRDGSGRARLLPPNDGVTIHRGVDAAKEGLVEGLIRDLQPAAVINCVGVIKQLDAAEDPLVVLPINALLPHRLARATRAVGGRLVHISTDCVFSGDRGGYREQDRADPVDLYGHSKLLGEAVGPGCLTLRTSLIGRELGGTRYGLVEWFRSQQGRVRGFAGAIFSGLPCHEMAEVLATHVLPRPELEGLYHLSADPISKYDLLHLLRQRYGTNVDIDRVEQPRCDRSLDSSRFRQATGYRPRPWPELCAALP